MTPKGILRAQLGNRTARDRYVKRIQTAFREAYAQKLTEFLAVVRSLRPEGPLTYEWLRSSGHQQQVAAALHEFMSWVEQEYARTILTAGRLAFVSGANRGKEVMSKIGAKPPEKPAVKLALEPVRRVLRSGHALITVREADPMPIGKPRQTARVVMLHKQQILAYRDGTNGLVFLPGGGVEDNEDWPEAAIRELFEETGIVGNVEGYLCDLIDRRAHRRYFKARYVSGTPRKIDLDGDIPVEVGFYDPVDLTSPHDRFAAELSTRTE